MASSKVFLNHGDQMDDKSVEFGRLLASPKPGDEVVITGLSGQYPNSKDVHEFRDNLINKVDMVDGDTRRWEPGHPEIPQRTGKLPEISKFDAGFFGVHHRQATASDPMLRIMLETAFSAILDAGVNPLELEGSNTGVFVSACFSESENHWFFDKLTSQSFAITGCQRSMLANRISYFLKLKGPSFICDTACSSSLFALEYAYKAIRMGKCDQAIVAGSNLCLHPFVSLQFARLGILSIDGACKVFDKRGNGYARSEAISAVFLQKAKYSRRIYCTILHAKTNCDGYKNSGITYPSGEMQVKLLKEIYQECTSAKPEELSFLEAHGTGTKVGDPEELQAIEEVFLPGRSTPLLIGSVKSSIGHTEPSSGLCSMTKVLLGMENGLILPNIHFIEPRADYKPLVDGRLKVVTENTPFSDDKGLIGINSFGFGGGNCHILLKRHSKVKSVQRNTEENINRLVCVSGRTKDAVEALLDDVISNKSDVEHIRLLHEIFKSNIPGHLYRGYILTNKTREITRSCTYTPPKTPNLILCFGPASDKLRDSIYSLIHLPVVLRSIDRLEKCVTTTKCAPVVAVISKPGNTLIDKILSDFFLHVILVDLIKACDIVPDKIMGLNCQLSLGLLVAAYFDAAVSLKEAVDCAVTIAQAANIVKNGNCSESVDLSTAFSKNGSVASQLQKNLKIILNKPKKLSKNVISGVIPSELSSVYFMNSFSSLKEHLQSALTPDDVILEVGDGSVISLIQKTSSNLRCVADSGSATNDFLEALGWLYEKGFNPKLHNIYPNVEFPVSRGTPMISPKIQWKHEKDWFVIRYRHDDDVEVEEKSVKLILKDPLYQFLGGHVIDGRVLFPAAGYLQLVWDTLAHIRGLMAIDMKIVLENCKFRRACTIHENRKMELVIMIQRGTGQFEVVEGGTPVVTGVIKQAPNEEIYPLPTPKRVTEDDAPVLNSKDIYKELKLRGYNYKDNFQSVQSYDRSIQVGKIKWAGNWITFIDNMLQLKIVEEDTRMLYVPIGIDRVFIDPKKHMQLVKSHEADEPELPVLLYKSAGIIRSGGIEIRGITASSISRRKNLAAPVLEKYIFVPNQGKLALQQAARANAQIVLENVFSIHVKAVEVIDESTQQGNIPLGKSIYEAFADQPLIQPDITILSKEPFEVENVKVEDKKLFTEVDCDLVIASKLLQRPNILSMALAATKENSFILSRESLDFDLTTFSNEHLVLVTLYVIDQEQLVLLRKKCQFQPLKLVKVSMEDFTWLPQLQTALSQGGDLVAYAQGEPLNGLMGLVSCIRREPGGSNIRLMFLPDSAPEFDISSPFYKEQLSKNLAVNILKDGQWGTYRHLLLENNRNNLVEHCYMNSLVPGDLSSLRWVEGPLSRNSKLQSGRVLISVYYASLNFKDLMIASGRIRVDSIIRDRREQECVQGFEFSGRTQCGKRVFGIAEKGACASLLDVDAECMVEIPDSMTLEEAATIPVVYCTSYYALFEKAKLKAGESVLIHSGTGGIGQAAICLALHAGCTVYTTVGTKEKRAFLKKIFPQLTDNHIASSRDTHFEELVRSQTGGRGVDVVLNSLTEEKLFASVRCLTRCGRFVEIGKFDLINNNRLHTLLLSKGASFHGVTLDDLFQHRLSIKIRVFKFLKQGLQNGAVRPLNRTVFAMNQPEEAFRYMSTGQHTGKVLIKIRQEENEKVVPISKSLFPASSKYSCDSDKAYIICGGLGGVGLELADWLVLRGCRKLVLTSRTGIKTGYQAYRISIWKSYGCDVEISTSDITTYKGCVELLEIANQMGSVEAIFNLAVILKDGLLNTQTVETFEVPFGPKATATRFLDQASRNLCPLLRDFVVFSSVSCGRGNIGQSNYGMANAVMERICEKRRSEGLPGLAIQWGAIGDVGLVAELYNYSGERAIGGTLQQRISNCFQVLDGLLRQNESAVVSSIVVAEKRGSATGIDNLVDAVAHILGIKDLKAISYQATLAEIGMDSMTAVEVKQTLEREYNVFLTDSDIKTMTFARLMEIQAEQDQDGDVGSNKKEKPLIGMHIILRHMGDETTANLPELPISSQKNEKSSTVLIFPGVEGVITVLEPLYRHLKGNLVGLQYPNDTQTDSISEMVDIYLPLIESKLSDSKTFNILCYSFGGMVALEVASSLEKKGYLGTIICIDSSPEYIKGLSKMLEVESDDKLQVSLLVHLMSQQVPYEVISKHVESLIKLPTLEDRIKLVQKIVENRTNYSAEYQRSMAISVYKRLKASIQWNPDMKLRSKVVLFKPSLTSVDLPDADYGLSKYCCDPVDVRVFEGNHSSILENLEVAEAINSYFSTKDSENSVQT